MNEFLHPTGGELSLDVKAEVIASEPPREPLRKPLDRLPAPVRPLRAIRHYPVLSIAVAMLLVVTAGALGA